MSDIEIIKMYGSIENYIYEIQQENQQLKEKINTYENPEDLTLMFMYCDEKAKDKIKGLKEVIDEAREYVNNHIHQETFTGYMDSYELKKLLQILAKVGD